MASIQHSGFTSSQNQLSLIFKALGHPARIAIINKLVNDERVICKEFALDFPIAQSTISHHLKVLYDSGILGYEKVVNVTYYRINAMILDSTRLILSDIVEETEQAEFDYSATFFKVLPELE